MRHLGFQGQMGITAPYKYNLELLVEIFIIAQTRKNEEFKNQNLHTNEVLIQLTSKVASISNHNKMLKNQIFKVAH